MIIDELKRKAAEKSVEYVKSGMVLGLGTGSTVHFILLRLAELIKAGALTNIVGIPTSEDTERKSRELGIPISTLDEYPQIDLVLDGADEVDVNLNLIKGGGGAMLREKIIAQAGKEFIVVVDQGKLSESLFTKFDLPVEVIKMALRSEENFLNSIGGRPKLRIVNNNTFITDEGNIILDTKFEPNQDLATLNAMLNERAGIVGHGLFLNSTETVVVGGVENVKILSKKQVNAKIL